MTDNKDRIDSLKKELATVRSQRTEEPERTNRMRNSLSWRLTLPFRALRRAIIDPFTRSEQNKQSTIAPPSPIVDEPTEPAAPKAGPPPAYRDYRDFCKRMKPLVKDYSSNFVQRLDRLELQPLVSIVLPVYNPNPKWLREAIDSVLLQIYSHWELCIADDASTNLGVKETLLEYSEFHKNIKVAFREQNGHISQASNTALELATGEFVALLDHDDILPAHALARVVDCINEHPDASVIYSDEDKIDESGHRSQPHFKSDWNPDLLIGQNFISHLGVYRRSDVKRVGGFREGVEGAQDWDLVLRVSERCSPQQIRHIPEVLYHWRSIEGSTAMDIGEKNYAHTAAGKAIEDHLSRIGKAATLEPVDRYYWRPRYSIPEPAPLIAIVIPTKDHIDLLETCIDSIQSKTSYPNFQIVVADNDSEDPSSLEYFEEIQKRGIEVFRIPGKFNFSKINNSIISDRSESLICLLNNDTTIINEDWLDEMVMHACRDEIGIVGAKLLFPHDHVQHAGIVLGIGGIGSEAFKYIHKTDDGYIHRAFLIGNYSAVTGACMLFRKSIWEELHGLNEDETPNAYSDVDFCLRCQEKGYRILFTPFAQLYHHQSASRGQDSSEALQSSTKYMQKRWGSYIQRDPYYNPNLTWEREDFTLTFPPRDYSTK